MRVIYRNSASITSGGPIELWHPNSRWYVVGRGYICQVDSKEEGLQVIKELKAAWTSAEPRSNQTHSPPTGLRDVKPDEAGRPGKATGPKKNPGCTHSRIVDYVYSEEGKRTGQVKCKECGAVFPDKPKE